MDGMDEYVHKRYWYFGVALHGERVWKKQPRKKTRKAQFKKICSRLFHKHPSVSAC